jgi:hypothetical protein
MISRPCKEFTPRERLAEMRWSLHRRGAPKRLPPRRIAMQDVATGRLLQGHASQHLTPEARRWRTMLRLRRQRNA